MESRKMADHMNRRLRYVSQQLGMEYGRFTDNEEELLRRFRILVQMRNDAIRRMEKAKRVDVCLILDASIHGKFRELANSSLISDLRTFCHSARVAVVICSDLRPPYLPLPFTEDAWRLSQYFKAADIKFFRQPARPPISLGLLESIENAVQLQWSRTDCQKVIVHVLGEMDRNYRSICSEVQKRFRKFGNQTLNYCLFANESSAGYMSSALQGVTNVQLTVAPLADFDSPVSCICQCVQQGTPGGAREQKDVLYNRSETNGMPQLHSEQPGRCYIPDRPASLSSIMDDEPVQEKLKDVTVKIAQQPFAEDTQNVEFLAEIRSSSGCWHQVVLKQPKLQLEFSSMLEHCRQQCRMQNVIVLLLTEFLKLNRLDDILEVVSLESLPLLLTDARQLLLCDTTVVKSERFEEIREVPQSKEERKGFFDGGRSAASVAPTAAATGDVQQPQYQPSPLYRPPQGHQPQVRQRNHGPLAQGTVKAPGIGKRATMDDPLPSQFKTPKAEAVEAGSCGSGSGSGGSCGNGSGSCGRAAANARGGAFANAPAVSQYPYPYPLMAAFSHWTHYISKEFFLVTDMQVFMSKETPAQTRTGASGKQQLLVNAATIHCKDVTRYLPLNTGKLGMRQFFASHTCNRLCKSLSPMPGD